MADEGPEAEGWQPTQAFLDAARRFAELRLTQKYRDDEVDYWDHGSTIPTTRRHGPVTATGPE